jgi:hypothetical protein
MEYGWVILFVICLIIVYASLGLPSGGIIGKTAFVISMPLIFVISALGAYSAFRGFVNPDTQESLEHRFENI